MSENKRYFWLKLKTDFFQNKEVKYLRQSAGGAVYTIIYLKLMLLSINDNGKIECDGLFGGETSKEIAMIIDEKPEDVDFTLLALEQCGLLKYEDDNSIKLTIVPDLIGSETDRAAAMRRLKKRRENEGVKNLPSGVKNLPEIEIEIEKEIDKELDIEIEKRREDIDLEKIRECFNETCVSLPSINKLNDGRKKAVRARLKEYTEEEIREAFEKVEASTFLTGDNNRGWKASFDWIMKPANLQKILDGNYDTLKGEGKKQQTEKQPLNKTLITHSDAEYFNDSGGFEDFHKILDKFGNDEE